MATAIENRDQIILDLREELNKFTKNSRKPAPEAPVSMDYQKLVVDKPPIFEVLEKLDYKLLLAHYRYENRKPLNPVKLHEGSKPVATSIRCAKCDAPSEYLYDNNGGRGQYKCKVCSCLFHENNRFKKDVALKCPYCHRHLEHIKSREDFNIYKCKNNNCSYYLRNLKNMTKDEKKLYKSNPEEFKLHYIYRSFKVDFVPLSKEQPDKPRIDLSRIQSSKETLGLVLTYYINYGLSARSTSAVMKDVHNISISRQTVLNYATALKPLLEYFNKQYPYELSDQFCGDETYLRVKGKWHYLCFFFDSVKKILLAYPISKHRDTMLAIVAINDLLTKLDDIPDSADKAHQLELIVDGNPIYNLAQQFFAEKGVHFDIKQVIGLANNDGDHVSKEYRPLKNVIERVNRVYKTNIRHFFGFGSMTGAEAFTTLFVTFFNFLRPHSALDGYVPVMLDELKGIQNMPMRWIKLLDIAQNFAIKAQIA